MKGVIAVLVMLSAAGCSLEAARTRRINSQLAAHRVGLASPEPSNAKTCTAINDWKLGLDIGGGAVVAPIGVAAGIVAAADTSPKVESYAIATGLGAAAAEAIILGASSKLAAIWEEKCQ